MATKNIVKIGYVVIAQNRPRPSAVLSKKDAENLQKRFGGRIVDVKGYTFYKAQGFRTLDAKGKSEVLALLN